MPDRFPHPRVEAVAQRAFHHRVRISHALALAGVSRSTWVRWKNGKGDFHQGRMERLERALETLIAERSNAEDQV